MLRRIVILFVVVFLLDSCSQAEPYWYCLGLCDPAGTVANLSYDMKKNSKSGPGTTQFSKGKKSKVLSDVLNRPINKKVNYEGITILIPEGTKLNDNKNIYINNIVDVQTGIGLPVYITFERNLKTTESCSETFYCKEVKGNFYSFSKINYNGDEIDKNAYELLKKIARVNEFKRGTR